MCVCVCVGVSVEVLGGCVLGECVSVCVRESQWKSWVCESWVRVCLCVCGSLSGSPGCVCPG